MLQAVTPIPEEQIRRAVDEVFRSRVFKHATAWDRISTWLADLWARFWGMVFDAFNSLGASKPIAVVIITLVALALLAFLARSAWLWRERGRVGAPERTWGGGGALRGDPWAAAQALAAAGDYTAAAHALYGALLEAAARAQQVRLHPSKTAGDYSRELHSRRSLLFPRFRDFAGDYEVVIYGDQRCDRDRFHRLFELAQPMLSAHG